jgi:hypothetical protein
MSKALRLAKEIMLDIKCVTLFHAPFVRKFPPLSSLLNILRLTLKINAGTCKDLHVIVRYFVVFFSPKIGIGLQF